MAFAAIGALIASALGWGALGLRVAGGKACASRVELLAFCFILGQGLLGWLAFWPGVAGKASLPVVAIFVLAGLTGLPVLVRSLRRLPVQPCRPDRVFLALTMLAALIGLGDLLEALSPPADADSLAYHFVIARHLAGTGTLEFIPRAVDGAVPPLTQLVFGLAYVLGGERAMTLWTMVSGWGVAFAVYALALRGLDRRWAAAAGLVVMSMPAILFGAGTGQVEVRSAAFATLAMAAAADSLLRRDPRMAVLAGLAAGFMMASKMTGILLVAAIGVVLLAGPGRWRRTVAFGLAAMAAGVPYYFWCWLNTGDPVFPMLWGKLPYADPAIWNAVQDAYFKARFTGVELAVPKSLFWWLAYPVRVLVDATPVYEAGRTGFGPFPLMVAPFAAWGAWRHRRQALSSSLLVWVVVALLFYSLWFWLGPSQRVRHLLPVLPALVLALMVAAERATRASAARGALIFALAATLAIQCAGQAVFSRQHVARLLAGLSREEFLARNVSDYQAASWMNAHLPPGSKVLHERRELNYLLTLPSFQANPEQEARVEVRPDNLDATVFWRQLRAQGIGFVYHALPDGGANHGVGALALRLESAGCALEIARFHQTERMQSRALGLVSPVDETGVVWQLTPEGCRP